LIPMDIVVASEHRVQEWRIASHFSGEFTEA
jgi:hypothetical protein